MTSPARIGPYEVVSLLGRGGLGSVYRVKNPAGGPDRALKLMKSEWLTPIEMKRFEREFRLARSIRHPNVARVFDFGQHEKQPYYTMEVVDGVHLAQWVHSNGRNLAILWPLIKQCIEGVGAIHAMDIVHHDLKPGNMMVSPGGLVRIVDFGLAWAPQAGSGLDQKGVIMGTPEYMAPEQFLDAEPDLRADIYSLGIMMYELLSGVYPFPTGDLKFMVQEKLHGEPIPLQWKVPELPANFPTLVMRMLARDPADRPSSCEEVLSEWTGEMQTMSGSAATRLFEPRFVGRQAELKALHDLLRRAADGQAVVVFLAGENGSGKATFMSHVARSASFYGFEVGRGAWVPSEPIPLGAFLRAFGQLPVKFELPQAEATGEGRAFLFNASVEYLKQLLYRGPVLLLLEEAHCMEPMGYELLEHLIRVRHELPRLAIVVSYREDVVLKPLRRLVSATVDRQQVHLLTLPPLEPEAVSAIVTSMLGSRQVDESLVETLVAESAGNPLRITEEVRAMVTSGALRRDGSQWVYYADERVRESLGESLARRFQKFSEGDRRVLQQAAVLGHSFPYEWLRRTFTHEEEGLDVVDRALSARILIRRPSQGGHEMLSFYHPRLREALLEDISPRRLQNYHLNAAVALHAFDPDDVFHLAFHWQGAGDVRKASGHLREAARRARLSGDLQRAVECLEQALQAVPESEEAQVREDMVNSLMMMGREEEAITQLRRLLERKTATRVDRMRLYRKLGNSLAMNQQGPAAFEAFNEGIALVDKPPSRLTPGELKSALSAEQFRRMVHLKRDAESNRETLELFNLYSSLAHLLLSVDLPNGHLLEQLCALHQLSLGEELGDSMSTCRSLLAAAHSNLRHQVPLSRTLPMLQKALEIAPLLPAGAAKAKMLLECGWTAMQTPLWKQGMEAVQQALQVSEASGDVVDQVEASTVLACLEMLHGDLGLAHTILTGAWSLVDRAQLKQQEQDVNALLALVDALAGETQGAASWLSAAARSANKQPSRQALKYVYVARAWMLLLQGNKEAAVQGLREVIRWMVPGVVSDFYRVAVWALYALAQQSVGIGPKEAADMAQMAQEIRKFGSGFDFHEGAMHLLEGLADVGRGRLKTAPPNLQKAVLHFEAASMHLLAGYTAACQVRVLNGGAPPDDAIHFLEEAGAGFAAAQLGLLHEKGDNLPVKG